MYRKNECHTYWRGRDTDKAGYNSDKRCDGEGGGLQVQIDIGCILTETGE